jgi:hypothetical protein
MPFDLDCRDTGGVSSHGGTNDATTTLVVTIGQAAELANAKRGQLGGNRPQSRSLNLETCVSVPEAARIMGAS